MMEKTLKQNKTDLPFYRYDVETNDGKNNEIEKTEYRNEKKAKVTQFRGIKSSSKASWRLFFAKKNDCKR